MSDTTVHLTEQRGWYTVTLDRGANALDEDLVERLRDALEWLRNQDAPPFVLASAHRSLFCPGWDLKQLAGADRPRIGAFLEAFERLILDLFSYPAPTVAAIGGHAVAGGCLLAIACDQRAMVVGRPRIGLSEHNLGVPVPYGCVQMLQARLGRRGFDELVFRGDGCTAERAVELGLVQRVCGPDELPTVAQRLLQAAGGAVPSAWASTKKFAFGRVWEAMTSGDPAAHDAFLDAWFDPAAHQRIEAMAARLGR
jgi:enoyl-CoA hydratase